MFIGPRNGASIDRIYLHTNEGPLVPGSALGLANELRNNGPQGGGYHVEGDFEQVIRLANDDEVVWGEGDDNEHCLCYCYCGYAAWTPEQWASPQAAAMIALSIPTLAGWAKDYNVPILHVAPGAPGQIPTERGFAEHADDHAPASQGHWDPGPGFPIDHLLQLVSEAVNPLNLHDLEMLAIWKQDVTDHPLHAGYQGWQVTALKQMLNKLGAGPGNDTVLYGPRLVDCVKLFKVGHGVGNDDGTVFGGPAADALFRLL